MANTMSMCGIMVEPKDIPVSMALNSVAFSVGNALGPPIGGVIVAFASWEYCFFINVVFGIIALVLSLVYLPKIPKFVEGGLDWFGGVLILLGFICLILGMTLVPPENGKTSCILGGCFLGIGILILVGFVFWEGHHPYAIMPKGLLRNKKIILALCAGFVNFAMMTSMTFQLPIMLETFRCMSAWEVGLY